MGDGTAKELTESATFNNNNYFVKVRARYRGMTIINTQESYGVAWLTQADGVTPANADPLGSELRVGGTVVSPPEQQNSAMIGTAT